MDDVAQADLPGSVIDSNSYPRLLVEELIDSSAVHMFEHRAGSGKRLRGKPSVPEQGSLFG
jgi:hypothetical protein